MLTDPEDGGLEFPVLLPEVPEFEFPLLVTEAEFAVFESLSVPLLVAVATDCVFEFEFEASVFVPE